MATGEKVLLLGLHGYVWQEMTGAAVYMQVCPAGWKPGDVTMKPTPVDSKEYFAAL